MVKCILDTKKLAQAMRLSRSEYKIHTSHNYINIQVFIACNILFFRLFIALLIKTKLPIVILKNGTIRSYICRNESHRHSQSLHCFGYPWVSAKIRPLIEINMTQVLLVLDTTLFITDASTRMNLWI
jgi:hypothetical protein